MKKQNIVIETNAENVQLLPLTALYRTTSWNHDHHVDVVCMKMIRKHLERAV